MNGWKECTLGDVIKLQRGHDLTANQRRPGRTPIIGSSGLHGFHDMAIAPAPGVTIGRSGSIGGVHLVTEPFWPHNTVLYVTDFKGNDPKFVSYLLRTLPLAELNSGAAQPSLNRNYLYPLSVKLPCLGVQCRIAGILGAYDDLIEVNRRRVAVLEEMARGLFEEWFVRFRFPGHEAVPILDTLDGPLPEGWNACQLEDFLVLQRGYDLPTGQRVAGAIPVVSAGGFHGTHDTAIVRGPGVVTGRSGTVGQVHVVMEDFWPLNTTLYVKAFKKAGPAYATYLLRHFDLAQYSSGAAVPTLNRNHVHGSRVVAAPDELLNRFEKFAMEALRAADVIVQQSRVLLASRDLLLPRLISGQLSVASAERELEDVV